MDCKENPECLAAMSKAVGVLMPTKTEYREYIAGEYWQKRRKKFLETPGRSGCEGCGIPRWLAIIAYDQDMHVHHRNYKNLENEKDEDLSALCRRCHELETFSSSNLHEPQTRDCPYCHDPTWDLVSGLCENCKRVVWGMNPEILVKAPLSGGFSDDNGDIYPVWFNRLDDILEAIASVGDRSQKLEEINWDAANDVIRACVAWGLFTGSGKEIVSKEVNFLLNYLADLESRKLV